MASEYERVFLQLASEVPFSVKGMLIASQVRRENLRTKAKAERSEA